MNAKTAKKTDHIILNYGNTWNKWHRLFVAGRVCVYFVCKISAEQFKDSKSACR